MRLTSAQNEALRMSEKARKLRKKGELSKAIKIYTQALNSYPVSELYNERGITYAANRQFDESITDFDRAIDLKKDDADCFVNRGNVYLQTNAYEAAICDYDKAIELEPNIAQAYNGRGYAYGEIGQNKKAFKDLKTAIRLDDKYVSPYYNIGVLCFRLEKLEEAIDFLDRAAHLQPNDTWTLCIRGDVHKGLQNVKDAYDNYNQAVISDDSNLRARQRLAWLMSTCVEQNFRDGQKALIHAKWCCENTSWTDSICLQTLAAAYAECSIFDEALHWQKEAIRYSSAEAKDVAMSYIEQLQKNLPIRD